MIYRMVSCYIKIFYIYSILLLQLSLSLNFFNIQFDFSDNIEQLIPSNVANDRSKLFFWYLGCSSSSKLYSLKCAEHKSSNQILEAYKKIQDYLYNYEGRLESNIFRPTIDNIVFNKSIDHLTALNQFKQCAILTGHNSAEFATQLRPYQILGSDPAQELTIAQQFNAIKFYEALEKVFKWFPVFGRTNRQIVSRVLYEYLTPNDLQYFRPVDYVKKINDLVTDWQFACQSYQLASNYARTGNRVYKYEFNYTLSTTLLDPVLLEAGFTGGATHGDELFAMFGYLLKPELSLTTTQAERDFTQKIVFYWTNFVMYDGPSAVTYDSVTTWEPFIESTNYFQTDYTNCGRELVMSKDSIKMKTGYSSHHCKFWEF